MAVIAAFTLATAPDEPQSAAVIIPAQSLNFLGVSFPVVTINYTIRPPDPGVGYAF